MKYSREITPREEIGIQGVYINQEIICLTDMMNTQISAYNRYDGDLIWVIESDNDKYTLTDKSIIINRRNSIKAYSLFSGKKEWLYEHDNTTFTMKPKIIKNKILVVGEGVKNYVFILDISGNLLEKHEITEGPMYKPYYIDEEVIVFSTIDSTIYSIIDNFIMQCYNFRTGEVLWTKKYVAEHIYQFYDIPDYLCFYILNFHDNENSRVEKWQIIEIKTGKVIKDFQFSNYLSLNLFIIQNFGLGSYNGESITLWDSKNINQSRWSIKLPHPYYLESVCINNSHYMFLLYSNPQMIQVIDINEGKKIGEYKLKDSPGELLIAYDNKVYYSTSKKVVKLLTVKLN